MANNSPLRKPRIRKSAPTVRERADAAKAKAENIKPSKVSSAISKAKKPVSRLHLPKNKFVGKVAWSFKQIGRGLSFVMPKYFINAWREVRQVAWPSRRETWRLTLAVFVFAAIFGAIVASVDKGLDELFKKLVLK